MSVKNLGNHKIINCLDDLSKRGYMAERLSSAWLDDNFFAIKYCLKTNTNLDLLTKDLFKSVFELNSKYLHFHRVVDLKRYSSNPKKEFKYIIKLIFKNKKTRKVFIEALKEEFKANEVGIYSHYWYIFLSYMNEEDLKEFDPLIYLFICKNISVDDYGKYLNIYKKKYGNESFSRDAYELLCYFCPKEIFFKHIKPLNYMTFESLKGLMYNEDGYEILKYILNNHKVNINSDYIKQIIEYCIKTKLNIDLRIIDFLVEKHKDNFLLDLLYFSVKKKNEIVSRKIISKNKDIKNKVSFHCSKEKEFFNSLV